MRSTGQLEARADCLNARDQQLDGIALFDAIDAGLRARGWQGWNGIFQLTATPSGSRLVARTLRLSHAWRSGPTSSAQACNRCSQLSRTSRIWRRCRTRRRLSNVSRTRPLAYAESGRYGGDDMHRIADRGELDHPCTLGVARLGRRGGTQGQACLADAAGPDQC